MADFPGSMLNDTITGGAGDDTISDGGGGNDNLNGADGNDVITVTGGADAVDGGLGDDLLLIRYAGASGNFTAFGNELGVQNGLGVSVSYAGVERFDISTGAGADSIVTRNGADTISAGAGNDSFDTRVGTAVVDGGAGNDTWLGDLGASTADGVLDLMAAGVQVFLGGSVANVEAVRITTGSGDDTVLTSTGLAFASLTDVINGGSGDDTIRVGGGADTVNGGAGGDDLLIVDYAVQGGNFSTFGNELGIQNGLGVSVSYAEIERFNVATGAGNDTVITKDGADTISAGAGNDSFDTRVGTAVVDGGAGNDTWLGDVSAATIDGYLDLMASGVQSFLGGSVANVEAVRITTGSGDDSVLTFVGLALSDVVNAGLGNDTIRVGGGADVVNGGAGGDDLLIVDYAVQGGNFSTLGNELGIQNGLGVSVGYAEIERFNVATGAGNDTVITKDGADTISAGDGNDSFDTRVGTAVVDGGAGNDTWLGDVSAATIDSYLDLMAGGVQTFLGGSVANVEAVRITTGSGDDTVLTFVGLALSDVVNAGLGNDTIRVGGGADVVNGGAGGDDLLIIDYAVQAGNFSTFGNELGIQNGLGVSVSYAEIERFNVTTGAGADAIVTKDGADTISAGDGNDSFDTRVGTAVVDGGAGNDTWLGDIGAAIVDGYLDLAATGVQAFLGGSVANVEAVRITTGSGDDTVLTRVDLRLADSVSGGEGDDTVRVGGGADAFDGGLGADLLIVDYAGRSGNFATYGNQLGLQNGLGDSVGYAAVERLDIRTGAGSDAIVTLGGDDTISTGSGADSLDGQGGNDLLDGGVGNDTVTGGAGSDRLRLDYSTATTAIVSSPLAGSFAAGYGGVVGDGTSAFKTTYTGIESFALTGGTASDTLTTGDGSDRLDGGVGADSLTGGAGDDVYVVDDAGDTVVEGAGGGVDEVRTNLASYALGASARVERLTGTATITGQALRSNDFATEIAGTAFADTLTGGIAADTLIGGLGADILDGGGANDRLDGGGGDDTVLAGGGVDSLSGGDGNDLFLMGASSGVIAQVSGGDGFDTLDLSMVTGPYSVANLSSIEKIILTNTDDQFGSGFGDQRLEGLGGADNLDGFDGDDTVLGGSGDDTVEGGLGDDSLDGGTGDDTLEGGQGADRLMGGEGSDTASFGYATSRVTASLAAGTASRPGGDADVLSGIENLSGSASSDTLTGDGGANRLSGGLGDDTLQGGEGDDTLDGGGLSGAPGSDIASYAAAGAAVSVSLRSGAQDTGGAGTDTLVGIEGLIGSLFDDMLRGDAGNNLLRGGSGNDTLIGALGDDVLEGLSGFDTASYFGGPITTGGLTIDLDLTTAQDTGGGGVDTFQSIEAVIGTNSADVIRGGEGINTLRGNGGDDDLDGRGGVDKLYGLAGADTLQGGDGADYLAGGTEDDLVLGGADADRLLGEAGADTLEGGGGADQLSGGSGADVFVFTAVGDSTVAVAGRDTIGDFDVAGGDVIDLSAIDADAGTPDVDDAFVLTAAFTKVAGQLVVSGGKKFTLIEGDVDGDGFADFSIYLTAKALLTGDDFAL